MKQTILYHFVLLNNQNAVPILERNGAEACAIFRIKIEENARGEGTH